MKSTGPLVNWSIRLTQDEAEEWDDMLRDYRRAVGDRTINKTDIFRAWLAATPEMRELVTQALSQRRAS
jgi:hypothetical protein